MNPYHKIPTLFSRDPATNFKTLLEGEYATPELVYLACNEWVFTEKVDGTNIRVIWKSGQVSFGGKTDNAQIPALLVNRLNELFTLRAPGMPIVFDEDACLYGEGYGAKIQKGGGNYSATQEFVLFDVRVGDWWLRREDIVDVATKLGLAYVPIIGTGTLAKLVAMVRDGFKSTWGDFPAEGIVARPATELFGRDGHRIITKLKARDFRKA